MVRRLRSPEHLPGYGEMLRYWFTARAPDGSYARKPRRGSDAYGAVVDAAAVARESTIPTLHWFVEDVNAARWDVPTESFVAFDPDERGGDDVSGLKFYGKGVTARRRGSGRRDDPNMFDKKGSKDWAKRKFKLDFRGRDFRLRWSDAPDTTAVEELNLHSSFDEPGPESYLRETLAAAVFERLGGRARREARRPSPNGEFTDSTLVEQVDDAFLERVGHDPKGTPSRLCTGNTVICVRQRPRRRRAGTCPTGRADGARAPKCTGARTRARPPGKNGTPRVDWTRSSARSTR